MHKKIKTLDIILIAIILAGTAFGLYLHFDMNKTYPDEHIAAMFEPITSKYGIKIVYEIGDDFFSPLENPPIPAGPPKGSKVEPIRHRVLLRYPPLLQKALGKYPVEVIKKYLNAIYFANEIDVDGFKLGGTYDPFRRIIYMVDNGGNNNTQSMHVFHHEFSSLLLNSHSFFVNPWTDNNPQDFSYLYDINKNRLQTYNKTSLLGTEADYEKGFMNTYGQTDFGNDFSEYSAMIFTYPEKFKKIMNKYSRVRGKFKVWLEFYQKIDPIFTEEYLLGEVSPQPNEKNSRVRP
jgi:hypothetical protein